MRLPVMFAVTLQCVAEHVTNALIVETAWDVVESSRESGVGSVTDLGY